MDYEAAEHVLHEMEALYKDGTYSLSYSETAETRERFGDLESMRENWSPRAGAAAPTLVCFLSGSWRRCPTWSTVGSTR